METRSRRRRRRLSTRLASAYPAVRASLGRAYRAVRSRLRPWRPAICVDVEGGDARRLRRMLRRAASDYIRALGVAPPEALLLVVQRVVVQDGRELAALLQVFEDGEGHERTVVFLALSVEGREVDDEELPALLRHELQYALARQLGRLALCAPLEAERARRAAPVVPTRGEQEPPPYDEAPPPDEEFAGDADDGFAVAAER
jgi:hypothetical protein